MEFFQAIANMSGDSLAQHLANGISLGSLYALIAIGYTMVYGILLMINFAHGDIVMMACYFAFFGITVFHIPWYITFVAEYFYRRDSDPGDLSGHSRYYNNQPCCAAAHRQSY